MGMEQFGVAKTKGHYGEMQGTCGMLLRSI